MTTWRQADVTGWVSTAKWAVLSSGLAMVLLVAGCSSSSGGGTNTRTSLKSVALSAAEVGSGLSETVTIKASGGGTSVGSDQPTLQVCTTSFPSEKQRKQRLQQDYYDQPKRISASDEVVRYKSGGATKAYDEEKAALKKCTTTTDQTKNISTSGLEKDRVATTGKLLNSNGTLVYVATVYQWKNDLLNAVYVYRGSTAEALGDAVKLAQAAAKNLNAAK